MVTTKLSIAQSLNVETPRQSTMDTTPKEVGEHGTFLNVRVEKIDFFEKNMVQKIYFPREVLPISFVTSQFVNMLLSFIVIFAVMVIARYKFNPLALLCLIPVMLTEYILALGFTFILSAVTVYFQDMQFIMGILTMAWQFLSPIMYSQERVPVEFRAIYMYVNPMAPIIIAYRDILYYGRVPELATLLSALLMGILLFVIGWFTFDRMQRHFVEEM